MFSCFEAKTRAVLEDKLAKKLSKMGLIRTESVAPVAFPVGTVQPQSFHFTPRHMLEMFSNSTSQCANGRDEPNWAPHLSQGYFERFEVNVCTRNAACQVTVGIKLFRCLRLFSNDQACSKIT